MASLLEIDRLTIRFGGLTPINNVSYDVPAGKICAVIGPNGAGKTTVFNAVTGIYEPTEGRGLFQGQPLETPFRWRGGGGAAAAGLLTAFLFVLLAVNVDTLWKTAIKDNFHDISAPFPWGKALADGW